MIELTRALARSFRTVLRRSVLELEGRRTWPVVLCKAGDGGLTLQAVRLEAALRYHQPGQWPADVIAFPGDVLGEVEGRGDAVVTLENVGAGKGRARWDDGGLPRTLDFDATPPNEVAELPAPPSQWTPLPAAFLHAFDEAARTAPKESARYALSRVQLRGQRGEVVGTDGSQLLVQGGFPFPWAEDLLVVRVSAFGCRELAEQDDVRIGRSRNHVAVGAGPWTLLLALDSNGRFPDVQAVLPRTPPNASRLVFVEEDAAFLQSALPKLPGACDFNAPVTLDLDRPPAVRARAEGSDQVAEVPLGRCRVTGPRVRICTPRRLLHRMLTLGFREVVVASPDVPLVCRDPTRTYLWMPLDTKLAIAPGADVLHIGPGEPAAPRPSSRPPEKEILTMPPPPSNGHRPEDDRVRDPQVEKWDLEDVIAETEALRGVLHDAGARTMRLLAALKHQRRQSRAVKAAMQSLQQLRLGP
ncbi:MAG TPA: hypothetical protein VMS17_23170 [Gemmataceae bacterium]|nr:hypothetical protein [Gemmataceae bacterium]